MSAGAAAFDLTYQGADYVTLMPLSHVTLMTGLRLALPQGYEAQVRSRSGLAHRGGVFVLNQPWGTVDEDYRGEIGVILANIGPRAVYFAPGDRIAQLAIVPVVPAMMQRVDELPTTDRGDGGYGSTGAR